ncbi:hypothetical protein CK203_115557 [Vitis vinifera]|uniref:Secreted protein n=1 Tax=Vitis vinifera TaxID=29760 RepID=A0A438CC06_VITVI|nr:hypothetical protein CK203_115557 [Vitis vinifera]
MWWRFGLKSCCYSLTLWWEVRPVIRAATAGKRGKKVATREEVGGEACTRTGERVLEAKDGSRLEALLLLVNGTRGQSSGLPCWVEQSPLGVLRKQSPLGLLLSWTSLAKMVHLFGLPSRKISGRAKTLELTVMLGLDN